MGAPIPDTASLQGPFKPMRFEATVEDCVVHGEIPKDLAGGFYRVGPTFKRPTKTGTTHLLTMDGMIQGLVFDNGRVDFRNRWIRSPKYLAEEKAGRGLFDWEDCKHNDWRDWGWGPVKRDPEAKGVPCGTYVVNTFPFARELLASGEQGGPPLVIDPISLETKGVVSWGNQLRPGTIGSRDEGEDFGDGGASFAAHPKWDARTGDMYGWIYRDTEPYVTLQFVKPDGTVQVRDLEDAPYNSLCHDIWLTEDYVVMPFQQLVMDRDRIKQDLGMMAWDTSYPIVLALIPRHDINGKIRYVTADIPPEYHMHTLGARVEGNKIMLDAPMFKRPPFPFEDQFKPGDDVRLYYALSKSYPGRWTLDIDANTVRTEQLSDRLAELPKMDERYYARGYTKGYMIGGQAKRAGMSMTSLIVRDAVTGAEDEFTIRHDEPVGVYESTFAPRSLDAPEGDGYLIVPISRWTKDLGEFQIFDTHDITQGPIATIEIPFRMGWTPHGHWMDFR